MGKVAQTGLSGAKGGAVLDPKRGQKRKRGDKDHYFQDDENVRTQPRGESERHCPQGGRASSPWSRERGRTRSSDQQGRGH